MEATLVKNLQPATLVKNGLRGKSFLVKHLQNISEQLFHKTGPGDCIWINCFANNYFLEQKCLDDCFQK